MADEILIDVADGVATVTLNRPEQRNAMNGAMLRQLTEGMDALEARNDVRVLLVRGAGPAFSSGRDLREMGARIANNDPDADVVVVFRRFEESRYPTIAVVHGDAYAGGCELALHCDLRIASESARFCMPLARVGIMLALPLVQKLVEIIGSAQTRNMLLTGLPISAGRAHEIGMVHEVVAATELDAAAARLAHTVAGNAPLSLAGLKATVGRAISARENIAHDDLQALSRQARESFDASEGRRAILEKRKPEFQGR